MSRPIRLPKLPDIDYPWELLPNLRRMFKNYGRAAVEADRKGQSQACPDDCVSKASIVVTEEDVVMMKKAIADALFVTHNTDGLERRILESFAARKRGDE